MNRTDIEEAPARKKLTIIIIIIIIKALGIQSQGFHKFPVW